MSDTEWLNTLERKGYRVFWLNSQEDLASRWEALCQEVGQAIPVFQDSVTAYLLGELKNVLWIPSPQSRTDLIDAPVGVTGVSQLAAKTGTLMLAEDSGYGRWVSNIPPRHVALIPADRLASDWREALKRIRLSRSGQLPRVISWISGPSQTADIAGRLVRGMHGPRQVEAWIIGWEDPELNSHSLILDV